MQIRLRDVWHATTKSTGRWTAIAIVIDTGAESVQRAFEPVHITLSDIKIAPGIAIGLEVDGAVAYFGAADLHPWVAGDEISYGLEY